MRLVRIVLGASGLIFALYQLLAMAVGATNEAYSDPAGGQTKLMIHLAAMATGVVVALLCVFCPKPKNEYVDDESPLESSAPRPYF